MASKNAIELTDINQSLPACNDQKKNMSAARLQHHKKRERANAAEGYQCSDETEEKVEPENPAAAIFAMDGPSIQEVINSPAAGKKQSAPASLGMSSTATGSALPSEQKLQLQRNHYFDVLSLNVPSASGRRSSISSASKFSSDLAKTDMADNNGDDTSQLRQLQNQRRDSQCDTSEPGSKRKVIISLLIVAAVAITWSSSTQFSKSSLMSPSFRAPYFLVWFNTNFMIICFPLYVLLTPVVLACLKKKLSNAKSASRAICDAAYVFGPSGLTAKAVVQKSIPFTILWIAANYSYSQALAHVSAGETTAVFSSNLAFVYLLSWIFLHDAFVALRIIAMLLAIIGIVLMAHAEGLSSTTFVGVVCAVVAAGVSAIYKVLFKKIVGDANFGQVSLFMTMLGTCNLVLSLPVMLALILSGAESAQWSDVPWPYICGSALLSLLFNLFINVGIAYTHPVYISVGLFLGMPLNAIVDALWRHIAMNDLQIIGGVCIIVSFILLMLPENFTSSCLRWIGMSRHHRDVFIMTREPMQQSKR